VIDYDQDSLQQMTYPFLTFYDGFYSGNVQLNELVMAVSFQTFETNT